MPFFNLLLNHKEIVQGSSFKSITWERFCIGTDDKNLIDCRATPSSNKLTRWIIIYRNRNANFRDEYFKLKFTLQDFNLPIMGHYALININDKINKKNLVREK